MDPLLALTGIAVSAGALVALFVSEQTPLFGFRETGYRGVIVAAIVMEALAVALLTSFLVVRRRRRGGQLAVGVDWDPRACRRRPARDARTTSGLDRLVSATRILREAVAAVRG